MTIAPITDWTTLKAAISSYLWDRSDIQDLIPVFIGLCEAQLNRRLAARRMLTRASATIDTEFVMLPSDFGGVQSLYLDATPAIRVDYAVDSEEIVKMKANSSSTTGKPKAFTIIGDQMQFFPAPDASYTGYLAYFRRIPTLSEAQPTNWLVEDHPDVYLYGSLLQSAPWLKEDERIVTWGNLYTQIISDIQAADRREVTAQNLRRPDRFDVQ